MIFVVFDKVTGRVLRKGRVSETSMLSYDAATQDAVFDQDVDPVTEYINPSTKATTPRPVHSMAIDKQNPIANGQDKSHLSNIPASTKIRVNTGRNKYTDLTVDDGSLDLTFDTPGRYVVKIDAFPVQAVELIIDAT